MRSDIACAMRRHHHRLDASVGASGPHGFTVREQTRFVFARCHVHRIPHPTSVTTRTPLYRAGTAQDIELILAGEEAKYFCKWEWTRPSQNSPSGKSTGCPCPTVKPSTPIQSLIRPVNQNRVLDSC